MAYPYHKSASPHQRRRWIDRRVEKRHVRALIGAGIACHDDQTMLRRRRGDDQIGLRKCASGLASFLDQTPPFEHHVLGDRQHAPIAYRAYFVRQPIIRFGAPVAIGGKPDRFVYDFTTFVKSDHCSTRKARMSRTDAGNHGSALSAVIAPNRFAKSSDGVV